MLPRKSQHGYWRSLRPNRLRPRDRQVQCPQRLGISTHANDGKGATPNGPLLPIYRVSFLGIELPSSRPEAMLTHILLAIFTGALVSAILLDRQRSPTAEGRPPRRPSWPPLGIDRLWLASRAHKNNKGLELWTSMFKNWANPRRPLTFESRLGGNTVIFTEP